MSVLTEEEVMTEKMKFYDKSNVIAEDMHPVFVKNDWKWSLWTDNNAYRVPNESEISVTVCSLVKDLYHGKGRSVVSTGRIVLEINKCQQTGTVSSEAYIRTNPTFIH